MSTPTAEPFRPDASFAVTAQQEEIDRLRGEVGTLADRLVWQRACNLQIQAEARAAIASLSARLNAVDTGQPLTPDGPEFVAQEPPGAGLGDRTGVADPDSLGLIDSFDPALTNQDAPTEADREVSAIVGETISTDSPDRYDPTATAQLGPDGKPIPDDDDPTEVHHLPEG
jgi:hypothetical protein